MSRVRRKSKTHRIQQQIVSEEEEPSRRMTRAQYKKDDSRAEMRASVPGPSWVGSKFFWDSDTNTQSCSEAESTRRFDNGDKVTGKFTFKVKKRKAPGEPTIEELLRPFPEQLDELEAAPTIQSIAFALEWLEDIDTIRGRSSYQGVMSKRMRDRVKAVKKTMQILSRRMEEKGDLAYYKRKNAEL